MKALTNTGVGIAEDPAVEDDVDGALLTLDVAERIHELVLVGDQALEMGTICVYLLWGHWTLRAPIGFSRDLVVLRGDDCGVGSHLPHGLAHGPDLFLRHATGSGTVLLDGEPADGLVDLLIGHAGSLLVSAALTVIDGHDTPPLALPVCGSNSSSCFFGLAYLSRPARQPCSKAEEARTPAVPKNC